MRSPEEARRIAASCEPGSSLERFWLESVDVEATNEAARQRAVEPKHPVDLVENAPEGSAHCVCEDGSVVFDSETWPSWASRPRNPEDLTDVPFLKKGATDAEKADFDAFRLHRERVWRAFKALPKAEQAAIKAALNG